MAWDYEKAKKNWEEPGKLETGFHNLVGSAANVVGGLTAGIGQTMRANDDIQQDLWNKLGGTGKPMPQNNALRDIGLAISDWGTNFQAPYGTREKYADKGVLENLTNPEYWADPRGLTADAFAGLGSSLPFMAAGGGLLRLGFKPASWLGGGAANLLGKTKAGQKILDIGKRAYDTRVGGVLGDMVSGGANYGLTTAPMDALTNSSELIKPLKDRGFSDSEIAQLMSKASLRELPMDILSNMIQGNVIFGKGMGLLGKTWKGRLGYGSLNIPLEMGTEYVQEGNQEANIRKYLGLPYTENPITNFLKNGQFFNYPEEQRAANFGAIGSLLPSVGGTVKHTIFGKDTPPQPSQQPNQSEKNNTNGDGVVVIGDSILTANGGAGALKRFMPNATVDAQGGRRYIGGSGGLAVLKDLASKNQLGNTVVLELGTNGNIAGDDAKEFNEALQLLGDREIYLVTNYDENARQKSAKTNALMNRLAKENSNIHVIDWHSAAQQNRHWFGDGLHPSPEGSEAIAKMIYDAVSGGRPSQTQPTQSANNENLVDWVYNTPVYGNNDFVPKGRDNTIKKVIAEAQKQGVDPKLALAVAMHESHLNQAEGSKAGAIGVMQLMPDTAKGLGVNPYDEGENIHGGVKFLKQMLDRFKGNVPLAVAAYNAGPGAVQKYGGVPPYSETQKYTSSIVRAYGANAQPTQQNQSAQKPGGNVFGVSSYNMPTQSDRITQQVSQLKPGWNEIIPQIGGALKNKFGISATISSAARTAEHNAAVGGVPTSHHIIRENGGDALDMVFDRETTAAERQKILDYFKSTGMFKEVIYHNAGSGYHLHIGGLNADKISNAQVQNRNQNKAVVKDDSNFSAKQNKMWRMAQRAAARANAQGFNIKPEWIYGQWSHEATPTFDSDLEDVFTSV